MININSLLIKPSGPDCNIACKYCFYSSKKELFNNAFVHRMPDDTAERVIKDFLSIAADNASIGFQGGEPTLSGTDFFAKAFAHIKKYKKPGQSIGIALQTNGLLLNEEWAELLKANHVLVGLSIDGPEGVHNQYRRTSSGCPTHKQAAAKMELLKSHGVDFNTLTVITKANVAKGRELINYFLENGSRYMQFIPCVETAEGRIQDFSLTPGEYGKFLIEAFDIWFNDSSPEFYIRMFDEMLLSFMEYCPAACCFSNSCTANLVVEYDGSVFPCDFFVGPEWGLGNINGRSFTEIAQDPKLTDFISRKSQLDDKCGFCKWRSICWGDCPKYRLDMEGNRIDSAYFCDSYKMFFEHAAPKLLDLKRNLLKEGAHPGNAGWIISERSIERNAPCLCGSGLKYKKCCGPIKGI